MSIDDRCRTGGSSCSWVAIISKPVDAQPNNDVRKPHLIPSLIITLAIQPSLCCCHHTSLVFTLTSFPPPHSLVFTPRSFPSIKLVCHCHHSSSVSTLTSFLVASSPSFHQSLVFSNIFLSGVYTNKLRHCSPALIPPIPCHLLRPLCGAVSFLSFTPNPDANGCFPTSSNAYLHFEWPCHCLPQYISTIFCHLSTQPQVRQRGQSLVFWSQILCYVSGLSTASLFPVPYPLPQPALLLPHLQQAKSTDRSSTFLYQLRSDLLDKWIALDDFLTDVFHILGMFASMNIVLTLVSKVTNYRKPRETEKATHSATSHALHLFQEACKTTNETAAHSECSRHSGTGWSFSGS